MTQAKQYNYEWTTPDEIMRNRHKTRYFNGWGITTLAKIAGNESMGVECGVAPDAYFKAHELWLKLKDAFNAEAAGYDPNKFISRLGSIGPVEDREVMRSAWWEILDGDDYGDYDTLTRIIEALHGGERLETGIIGFGS